MTTMYEKLRAIETVRERRKAGGGPAEIDKQHQKGRLTARERLDKLLAPGTFQEIDLWSDAYKTGFDIDEVDIPGDALIAGWGEVDGRPIYVWAQDAILMGGTMAEIHIAKIVRVMEKALIERLPIVGIYDSEGVRIENAVTAHAHCTFGTMMRFQTISSGVIPQISLIMGLCVGGAALSAALSDFTFMVRNTSYMHVAPSPPGMKSEEYGEARMHARVSGGCDILAKDDEDCIQKCKELLSYLPLNNLEKPPVLTTRDDSNRTSDKLMEIVPTDSAKFFDMRDVIREVVDNGAYLELRADYARNLTTGFARFDGQPVGILASNSIWRGGCMDVASSDKYARFTRFCDAFNIPLIYMADCPAFFPSVEEERLGILRHGTTVIHAISEVTVPKITVFVRKCYGGAAMVYPGNMVKTDRMLAWPTVERGVMGAEGLAAVMYKGRLDRAATPEERSEIWTIAVKRMEEAVERFSRISNEDYIDPRQTRPAIIQSLRTLSHKKMERPARKHEDINL